MAVDRVNRHHRLAALEGRYLLSAPDALVKGALESEVEVALVAAPARDPFAGLFESVSDEEARAVLRQHEMQVTAVPHASRAVDLALAVARSGRGAVALVPNDQLDLCAGALARLAGEELPTGGAVTLILEDRTRGRGTCPRQRALALDLTTLEPGDLAQLREGLEQAMRLSRADRRAVAMIVHESILRTTDTVEVRPNRVIDPVDMMILRRAPGGRKKTRRVEPYDVLRTARRMELNLKHNLPSPGERVPVGFVVVGPAEGAIRHLTHTFRLHGRVPVLQLRLLHPIDEVALDRILPRCERIVVLEPRPGVIEARVLAAAERMRHAGTTVGSIWGRQLPPDGAAPAPGGPGAAGEPDDLHPSTLARRVVHLLHSIRPTFRVASQLVADPPRAGRELLARGSGIGWPAARLAVRRLLEEVDQWLLDGPQLEERNMPPSGLAIDGVIPPDAPPRLVLAEIWDPARFLAEGVAALRHAAREDAPWLLVVCDTGVADGQDLERLARGVVPEARAERVRIVMGQLDDTAGLREILREAVLEDRLTVIIARDGVPARYGVEGMERALAEIDRLGFEPRQRMTWPADQACAFRPATDEAVSDAPGPPARAGAGALSVDRLPRRLAGRVRVSVRPRLERVEVVRSRAPAQTWRRAPSAGLPLPEVRHGHQSSWRVHLAGYRGQGPGPAALALLEAGRMMGYAPRSVYDPAPIGPGRRAWAQVLFTNPRPGESSAPLTARIPFGEADLLLGLDVEETLRAVSLDAELRVAHADRTCAVVNGGALADPHAAGRTERALEMLLPLRLSLFRDGGLTVEDVAGACRAWIRTERVTDLALLGLAFQKGYVPLTVEAIETGVERVESGGRFARAMEAFRFGRRLALDARLLRRPKPDEDTDLPVMIRRTALLLRCGNPARGDGFRRLVEGGLAAMPGLAETEAGRRAGRDFVLAVRRCVVWGGLDYAQRYCDLITALYRADRGDHGRSLTRHAVLPLAEAMLIREPLYVLAMATGPIQARRTRLRLNVKRARGDELHRRYVTRLELVALRHRVRLDLRTGEGPARLFAGVRHVIPDNWRGTRRERDLRGAMIDLVARATRGAANDYDRWAGAMQQAHQLAAADRLRSLGAADLRQAVETDATRERPGPVARPHTPAVREERVGEVTAES